ncbi:MAG: 30S ribosomal protein S1 [Clostridia bacterium]|nr:30S ribosomal protein S1 [Clostridia bacterium]
MPQGNILPEGSILSTAENIRFLSSPEGLRSAYARGEVLEAVAERCDAAHNLHLRLPGIRCVIPRAEAALGIADGSVRDIAILSRVGRPVAFRITDISGLAAAEPSIVGSRCAVQAEARDTLVENLLPGDILRARVTHLESFGCFADIGRGVVSMIGADRVSVSRIRHTAERFRPGQEIFACVLCCDPDARRVYLTHRELLGTWEENAARFSPGETVRGIVRGIEEYGVFVELAPNLSGLAEPCPGLQEGDLVSVFIKSICPERMKIKLSVIGRTPGGTVFSPPEYFIREGRLRTFRYAPAGAVRTEETVFA